MKRNHLQIVLTAVVAVALMVPFLILHYRFRTKKDLRFVIEKEERFSLETKVEGTLLSKTSNVVLFESPLRTTFLHDFTPFVEREAKSRFLDPHNETAYCVVSPSLIRRGEGLLVAFQVYHCPMKQRSEFRVQPSVIFVQSFDRHLASHGYGHLLGYGAPRAQEFGPLRPRAFQIADRPYITFHPGITGDIKDVVTWPVIWDVIDRAPIIPRPNTFGKVADSDEWMPLVVKERAYFVQALAPELKVVQCKMSGQCSRVATEQHDLGRHWDLHGGAPFQLYHWPYYVSLVTGSHSREYNTSHLVVLQAEPFRILYVSEHIPIHQGVFQGRVLSPHLSRPSVAPSGLLVESRDSLIFGASINDAESGLFRLRGLRFLMHSVTSQGYAEDSHPNPDEIKQQEESNSSADENLRPRSEQSNVVILDAGASKLKDHKGPTVRKSSDWNAKRMNIRNEDSNRL